MLTFKFDDTNIVANNLGGLGPNLASQQEMRFKNAGISSNGQEFDFVVKVLDTQQPYISTNTSLNIAAGGGFQINSGGPVDPETKNHITEFEISFEDQQGQPVDLDLVNLYLLDLDRDAKLKLREVACYNLDTLDLEGSDIPGFDSNTLTMKPHVVEPGFKDSQLITTYNNETSCDGNAQTKLGSVTVKSNQVGFKCDLQLDVATSDFKPVKCEDGCFTEQKCKSKKKFFGLVDQNGNTCNEGSPGCDFQSGINPLSRVVQTRYKERSSLPVSLGLECLKPVGQTCTRNLVFRATYEQCACVETQSHAFNFDENNVAVNNLGGKGPEYNSTQELRYKNVGRTRDHRMFDLVVVVAEGQSYAASFKEAGDTTTANGAFGKLGTINVEVVVTAENNGEQMTEFIFTIEDSLTGEAITLDDYEMSFFDFDVNKQNNLHELVCFARDQFDETKSVYPPETGDVDVSISNTSDCAHKDSQSGSVTFRSQGVGFLCDNPTSHEDLADVTCEQCFTGTQAGRCQKTSFSKYFPVKRHQRVAKIAFQSTSTFSVSLGVKCEKSIGGSCNRNFLFTGSHAGCKIV